MNKTYKLQKNWNDFGTWNRNRNTKENSFCSNEKKYKDKDIEDPTPRFNINNNKNTKRSSSVSQVTFNLYNKGKQWKTRNKINNWSRSRSLIEKDDLNCTFTPQIHKTNLNQIFSKTDIHIKFRNMVKIRLNKNCNRTNKILDKYLNISTFRKETYKSISQVKYSKASYNKAKVCLHQRGLSYGNKTNSINEEHIIPRTITFKSFAPIKQPNSKKVKTQPQQKQENINTLEQWFNI